MLDSLDFFTLKRGRQSLEQRKQLFRGPELSLDFSVFVFHPLESATISVFEKFSESTKGSVISAPPQTETFQTVPSPFTCSF